MREFFQQIPKVFQGSLAALALALFAAPAFGADPVKGAPLNQRDIQVLNRQVNDKGSDASLRNSAVFAMQALMDLSATKLPSAMTNGYKAYGKFRNSENLDRLKDINALNANSLASIGAGTVELPVKTNTSFRRLDPSFLYEGEAAKVAAEFERQSGMKRNDFLTQLADVSEKKIKRSDPQMIDKAFAHLEGFIDKIPNQEFRRNLEKNIHIVPESMRRGMVAQAVTKLAGFFAHAGTSGAPTTLEASTAAEPSPASLASAGAHESPATEERKPAAVGDAGANASASPHPKSLKSGQNALNSVVLSALKTQVQDAKLEANAEPTIFQQVTLRIRALTPGLNP